MTSSPPDRLRRTFGSLAAFVLLVGSGLVHGRLTDRWGTSTAIARAIARLDRVPRSIGDWDGRDVAIDRRQIERAQIHGHRARTYRNVRDGREITVLLVCGRPGPIAAHPPDVCYAGAGYETGSPPMPGAVAAGGRRAAFKKARFRKADALVPEVLDIAWTWNGRGVWEAPDHPRIEFASCQALFKVYVIAARSGPMAADPAAAAVVDADFAGLILATLDRALFEDEDAPEVRPGPESR